MRLAGAVALVVAVAAAGGLAGFWLRTRDGSTGGERPVPSAPGPTLPSPGISIPPPDVRRGLPRSGRRTVRAALDTYIADAGLEASVTEADRRELMTALARVRRVNLARHRISGANRRRQERYARMLNEADTLFRARLGIGVHEFIAAQGAAGNIDDLGGRR